jgi:tetratricopeptide (TPR) repeat protein
MRGKLEQPKGLIELISIEVERIDLEYSELWLSYEFSCPGGEYKSAMCIPISSSKDMTDNFFKELIYEAERVSDIDEKSSNAIGLYVSNKSETMLPVKNLCQRIVDIASLSAPLDENREYINLCTTGTNFKEPSKSLQNKDFEERFKLFIGRAKKKMAKGHYTIAADDLEKAKVLCATSTHIYKLIGICHRELGHLDLAKEMFSNALELGDVSRDTFLYLAETSFFLGDMSYSESVLERMLLQYPKDIRGMVELANVRYQLGKEYIDEIDNACSIDEDLSKATILQTFVFKKVNNNTYQWISDEEASQILDIPTDTIRTLAVKQKIPARIANDDQNLFFDKNELEAWAFVYRRCGLLKDEIDRIESHSGQDTDTDMALLS